MQTSTFDHRALPSFGALGLQSAPERPPTPPTGEGVLIEFASSDDNDYDNDYDSDVAPFVGVSTGAFAAASPPEVESIGHPGSFGAHKGTLSKALDASSAPPEFNIRQGLFPTAVDVTMHAPAPTPEIDRDPTLAQLRSCPRDHNVPLAPVASHLVVKEGSDCYCMNITLSLGAYDLDGSPVSHNGTDIAPNWLAMALRMGSAPPGLRDTNGRLRSLYGPMLNALVARLKSTVYALLSHENLGLNEVQARIDLGDDKGRVQSLVSDADASALDAASSHDHASVQAATREYETKPPMPESEDMLGNHATMTITLRVDPLTSRMLSVRFAEYDRLRREASLDEFDAMEQADGVICGGGQNDNPIPYGIEDLLWGQTVSEMLWLSGAEMCVDAKRRDAVAFRECRCDAGTLKPPNAPPHFALPTRKNPATNQCVARWRLAVAPMSVGPC